MLVSIESEKSRLQRIFENSNRRIGVSQYNRWSDNDQVTNENVQLIRKQMQKSINEQKQRLDILANEVVDRETVLKVMRNEGQKELTKRKLKVEIQERMKHMKELQNNISRQERQNKQSKLEALLVDSNNCCQATYNAQKEKNKTNGKIQGGYSSHSKRLLEHNLNNREMPRANHRRYKHSNSLSAIPILLLHRLESNIEQALTQTKEHNQHYKKNQHLHHQENFKHQYHNENHQNHNENHQNHKENHQHHKKNHQHHKENHHHGHKENHCDDVDQRLDGDSKHSRHHKTRCQSKIGLKNNVHPKHNI